MLVGEEEVVAVQLTVDLFHTADGRLEGTVITESGRHEAFSGTLDLLRVLEDLQLVHRDDDWRPS
jgi:hypothetical protein